MTSTLQDRSARRRQKAHHSPTETASKLKAAAVHPPSQLVEANCCTRDAEHAAGRLGQHVATPTPAKACISPKNTEVWSALTCHGQFWMAHMCNRHAGKARDETCVGWGAALCCTHGVHGFVRREFERRGLTKHIPHSTHAPVIPRQKGPKQQGQEMQQQQHRCPLQQHSTKHTQRTSPNTTHHI
jgi:hypothetical protein